MRYKDKERLVRGVKSMQQNKNVARRMFGEGKKVFLHPCNMWLNNPWQGPMEVRNFVREDNESKEEQFNKAVNSFTYYNCDSARGRYPSFFVEL